MKKRFVSRKMMSILVVIAAVNLAGCTLTPVTKDNFWQAPTAAPKVEKINIIKELEKNESLTYYFQYADDYSTALRVKSRSAGSAAEQMALEEQAAKIEAVFTKYPTLVIEKGDTVIKLFGKKDEYEINGSKYLSKAPADFIDGGNFMVTKDVLEIINK